MTVQKLIEELSKLSPKQKKMKVFFWWYTDTDYEVESIKICSDDDDDYPIGVELKWMKCLI